MREGMKQFFSIKTMITVSVFFENMIKNPYLKVS